MSSNEENGKSEKRLISIGEVSKAIGITRRIILNYEAKGLLLPDKKEGTAGNHKAGTGQTEVLRGNGEESAASQRGRRSTGQRW